MRGCKTAMTLVVVMALGLTGLIATPALATPGNDEPANATVIDAIPFTNTIDTTDATAESDQTQCTFGGSVWYRFTPATSQRLVADTFGSDFNSILAVYTGVDAPTTVIGCNDDWRSRQSRVGFDAEAGETYWFKIGGYGGVLEFHLTLAVKPPNDEIDNAKKIPLKLPWKFSQDTVEATLNVDDPACSGRSRSVWFTYKRPKKWSPKRVLIKTIGSDYDTTLAVYTGSAGSLEQKRCSDNAASTLGSKVKFIATPGERYYVYVGSANNSAGGKLKLNVKDAPLPFKMSAGIDATGQVSGVTGTATLSGRVVCNRSSQVEVRVWIRQRVDDHVVSASNSTTITCRQQGKRWSLNLGASRPFETGSAGAWMSAYSRQEQESLTAKKVIQLYDCSQCL